MNQRLKDFIASFGVMIVGVAIMAFGSVSFTHSKVDPVVSQFPLSKGRVIDETQRARVAMFPISRPAVPVLKEGATFETPVTAAAILVVDDKTNTVLYKKNNNDIRPLASITKLVSALTLLDLPITWTSTTVITEEDIADDHHVKPGEQYTLQQLWTIGLVGSSNSAIKALVRSSGLSEELFAVRMNNKVRDLGLLSMRFVEPTGLDNRNLGTAMDVSRLLKAALEQDKIRGTLAVGEYNFKPVNSNEKKRVWSTNWLLTEWIPHTFSDDVIGKTGFITESGYNVAVRVAGKDGHLLRVVILGAQSNEFRFSEARDVAEWVFNHALWPADRYADASP